MIQCPNCGEEIADNSAHCGFCGAQIDQESGKKTMIGMAAVTAEDMARVARETKEAREAAERQNVPEGEGLGNERSKPAGLSIPKPSGSPGASTGSSSSSGLPGKLNIPKPGQPSAPTAGGGDQAPPDAKTEVMNAVGPGMDASQLPIGGASNPPSGSTIEEAGPTDPFGSGGFATDAPQTPPSTDNFGAGQDSGFGGPTDSGFGETPPTGEPAAQQGFGGQADSGFGAAPTGDAPDATAQQGFGGEAESGFGEPPAGDPNAPQGFGGTPPAGFGGPSTLGEETMKEVDPSGVRVPDSSAGPSEFGDQPMTVQENTLPEKKNNKAVLVIAAVAALLMFCCIASAVLNFLWPLL